MDVRNASMQPISGVHIHDDNPDPSTLTFVGFNAASSEPSSSIECGPIAANPNTIQCNDTTLAPAGQAGDTKTYQLVFRVSSTVDCRSGKTYSNSATVFGDNQVSVDTAAPVIVPVRCAACDNGVDDDNPLDGRFDCGAAQGDPGCHTDGNVKNNTCDPNDDDESHVPQCGDGVVDTALGEICDEGRDVNGTTPGLCLSLIHI